MSNNILELKTLFLVFTSAVIGALVSKKLKLPSVLGYIIAGLLIGQLFHAHLSLNLINLIADIGITLLLFTVGLEFSVSRFKSISVKLLIPVILQILIMFSLTFGLCMGFGFSYLLSLFIASGASLSSTAIVYKYLSEKAELDTVHGQAATVWCLLQDISVIPIFILLPTLIDLYYSPNSSVSSIVLNLIISFSKSALILISLFFLGIKVIPKLLKTITSFGSRELLTITTVGIIFSAAFISYNLGISAPLGAFIAGLLIATTSQNHAIFTEIRPLRDLFVVVFFVSVGLILPISVILNNLPVLILLSLLILFFKMLVITAIMRFLKFHRKVAFYSGILLLQMSEFGFILGKIGYDKKAYDYQSYLFIISLIFMSILINTWMINSVQTLYNFSLKTVLARLPLFFKQKNTIPPKEPGFPIQNHVVICGYGRVGKYIGRALSLSQIPFIVIDYDFSTIKQLEDQGANFIYGDPADKDVLDYAQVDLAKLVIIAIPDLSTQQMIISNSLSLNRHIKIICRSHHQEDQGHLKSLGVTTIIQPEFEAAISIVDKILTNYRIDPPAISGKISRLKIEHGLG